MAMPQGSEPGRVLSIQSHVVSGYVGNRAATFPLQTLGYDVDVINTVQFSNHTGYGTTNGHKTTSDDLSAIFQGLRTNGLVSYSRILTGYIPGAEALRIVKRQIEMMKSADPHSIYVLDPVMGDVGKGLYVSQDVIPIYRGMLELATIVTPNQFEFELLSGGPVKSLQSLHDALLHLHKQHSLPHIALSSIPLPSTVVSTLSLPSPPPSYTRLLPTRYPPWYDAVGAGRPNDEILVCFASTMSEDAIDTWAFALPTIRGYFSGVGDLFSAMVLAHFDQQDTALGPPPLVYAVSKALLCVQQILLRTHLFSLTCPGSSGAATHRPVDNDNSDASSSDHIPDFLPSDAELDDGPPSGAEGIKRKARRMRVRELRLVAERELISSEGDGWPARRLNWNALL